MVIDPEQPRRKEYARDRVLAWAENTLALLEQIESPESQAEVCCTQCGVPIVAFTGKRSGIYPPPSPQPMRSKRGLDYRPTGRGTLQRPQAMPYADPQDRIEWASDYRARNKPRLSAYARTWRRANRDKSRNYMTEYQRQRRARLRADVLAALAEREGKP